MESIVRIDSKNRLIKLIVIVIPVILLLVVTFLVLNKNDYKKIEKQMEKNAREYIKNNNIDVTNQEFIFISDLDITTGVELCSKASGVVITNVAGSIKYYPYLKCIDYESKILNNTTSYIELIGPDVALVNLGTLYFDEGYTEKRDDIKVETIGEVPNEVGAYTINYVVTKNDKQKTIVKRIVIVSDVDTSIATIGFENKEEPNLVLKGEKEMVMLVNSKYEEPGYAAYDYQDGYLTKKVSVDNKNFTTDKVGKYEITYSVKNSRGRTAEEKRMISVVEKIGDLKIELSTAENGAVINESLINIHVSGADFEKIVMPDGTISEYTIADFTATKNGTYTFKVCDTYGNVISKSIVVSNIDSEVPTGKCSVEIGDVSVISVIANDDSGVKSVDYIINGNETGFLAATSYHTKEKISVANIVIKDVAGNNSRVACTINSVDKPTELYSFEYNNTKKMIACDSYSINDKNDLENRLAQAIEKVGTGTRAGVVEAARFLVGGLNYRIPYIGLKNTTIDPDQILGLYSKGLNIASSNGWGCQINGLTQGLSPIGFIKWAFANAGVTLDENFVASDVGANKIKPGDLFLTECSGACSEKYSDMGIVIGVDSNKIYVAEVSSENSNGLIITELSKKKLPKTGKFSTAILYNYASEGNLSDMWK